MNVLQIILTVCGAGVVLVNYTVYLCISRRNAFPFAPAAVALVTVPLLLVIIFGGYASAHFPLVYEILKWIYIGIGLLYSVSFFIFSAYLLSGLKKTEQADVFIVFGCKTFGYRPSYALKKRLDKAYELLMKNQDSAAVLSGGQGDDETVSEAESMRAYLVNKGVSEDRLIIEDKSTSTISNMRNSMELIRQAGLENKKISAVSNDFHIKRILKQAKQCGFEFYASPAKIPPGPRMIQNLTREYMVWCRHLVTKTWEYGAARDTGR